MTRTVTQALALRAAALQSEEGIRLYAALVELQRERVLAAEYLGAPSPEGLGALREQQTATDEALTAVDLAEEDDELLRAAEELGIDLSGVRAEGQQGNGAADEQEEQTVAEGEGGTDGAGAEEAEEAKTE